MSILLVGCGYWGQNWAKTLFRLNLLAGVCDPRPDIQATLRQQYPDVALFSDLEAALRDERVQAVVIATPVITHFEMARQCLEANRSVLVEKPLAFTPEEAQALVTLAEHRNLTLAVGHLLLYQPALLKLKTLMDTGPLGEILGVQCNRINLGKVRNEENVWWSLAPHDLSIIAMLLDEPLTVVQAQAHCYLGRPQLPDAVTAQLRSASGKSASVHVNWLSPMKRHETVVIGSQKIAVFEDTEPPERKLKLLDYALDWSGDLVQGLTKGTEEFVSYAQGPVDLLGLQAQAFWAHSQSGHGALPNHGRNGLQVVQLLSETQRLLDQQSAQSCLTL